jgi:predicted ATPase/class 3 adenylate cyclase
VNISPLPTGTVTFLFTDIEGSTALWEQYPDAMQAALARHDALLRRGIEGSRGHIVKTTGDGVFAVFGAATDALAACLTVQRVLQDPAATLANAEPAASDRPPPVTLRVRMGLHTGVAELRDADYFGAALNRAARIMSAAHGEQVLLSAATAELLRAQLPQSVVLREMGEHRLKGLLNPERVLQVVAPDLRSDFPPLASLTGHSLPAERDAFVGRVEPLAELARRLDAGARLVSVLGIGGTGKTRLVARFGWNWLGEFPGGVWFCDLAPASSVDGIVNAVAQGLDVPLGRDDPVTQLGHAIAGRGRCLVILDNFEQVARHAEPTLGRWLDRAEEARFVVTTREVLGLAGEEVLALPPLPPADALTLFVQRAEAAKPDFQPTAEDREAIAQLVALLDGLPLAIELAAARVRVMPPRTLLQRMSERFKLLASKGGRHDRQSTLRAAFDWSWGLLSSAEKAALAQLSVFEGGFTLEGAEAVLDVSGVDDAPWIVDVLHALVDKSFVRQRDDNRFDLLVSVQIYAAEHLQTAKRYAGSGPSAMIAAQRRHIQWFAALGPGRAAEGHCADLDNLIAACRRAESLGDSDAAAHALEGAWAALNLRGPFEAGAELAELVCAMPRLSDRAAARAQATLADALVACGRPGSAHALYNKAATLARAAGDRRCEAQVAERQGILFEYEGKTQQGRARYATAAQMARTLGDRDLECRAMNGLGSADLTDGRLDDALTRYELALALAREIGDRRMQGSLLGNLGTVHTEAGRVDEAVSRIEEALALARETGHRVLESGTLCNLGLMFAVLDRLHEADAALRAALAVARELGHIRLESVVLCNLGIVTERLGLAHEAQMHFEAALHIAQALGDPRYEGQFLGYLGLMQARQGGQAEARRCFDSGEALLRSVSDPYALGVLLTSRAEAEHLAGEALAATASLVMAGAIAAEVGAGPASELGLALARVRKMIEPAKE